MIHLLVTGWGLFTRVDHVFQSGPGQGGGADLALDDGPLGLPLIPGVLVWVSRAARAASMSVYALAQLAALHMVNRWRVLVANA